MTHFGKREQQSHEVWISHRLIVSICVQTAALACWLCFNISGLDLSNLELYTLVTSTAKTMKSYALQNEPTGNINNIILVSSAQCSSKRFHSTLIVDGV